MTQLVLIRHGQSAWNLENRFTGWWDVPVTQAGAQEARVAGQALAARGFAFDVAFTSVLTRAIQTLDIVLAELDTQWLPVTKDWRLNERHYGGLTGLDKAETAAIYGDAKVHEWRRSFDVPPPPEDPASVYTVGGDRRYKGVTVPATESLADTIARVLPYWESAILPELKAGKRVLITAHGNSLRALVKHLSGISDADIAALEIPTGRPIVYTLDAEQRANARAYLD